MNVSALKAYNPSVSLYNANSVTPATQKPELSTQAGAKSAQSNIISQEERDYFIKLFPDNRDQLIRYSLFNSSGHTQQQGVQKGLLVDARV